MNNLRKAGNSIGMKLVGTRSNRDAIGARVRLTVGGKTMMRQVEAGSGYASESMLAVHFGLGAVSTIDAAEVVWPSGLVQRIARSKLDGLIGRVARIEEGSDQIAEMPRGKAGSRAVASTRRARGKTL